MAKTDPPADRAQASGSSVVSIALPFVTPSNVGVNPNALITKLAMIGPITIATPAITNPSVA